MTSLALPTPLELINADDPAHYTKLVDLSAGLPDPVRAFNNANPATPIRIFGKCEFSNPGMSHKDRIAKVMLQRAEERGDLTGPSGEKKKILAASSGNTGCSLALVGTLMGYEVVIITNKKCSTEKRAHIESNGATLWMAEELPKIFPKELGGETDYMKQEDLLAAAFPSKYYSVNQYGNLDNMDAHEGGTGSEIWSQTGGGVTHFVMSASTGGTIMGVGKYLKERKPSVEVVLADPEKSHLHGFLARRTDGAEAGDAALALVEAKITEGGGVAVEGAGKNSLTGIMQSGGGSGGSGSAVLQYVDRAVKVHDFDAFDECRATAAQGMLVGGSAGLNLCAAKQVAAQCCADEEHAKATVRAGGAVIVTLLCDHGIKYLSKIFNDAWIKANDDRLQSSL